MRLLQTISKVFFFTILTFWLAACGGGGGGDGGGTSPVSNTKVLADNFDSGALATGVWKHSLDGVNRSIQGGRLVNTVTSSGSKVSVYTTFIRDYTYMETTVRISSDSVIDVGARGKVRLAGYFYNDRRGPGSGLPHNGYEGDVWGQVEVVLRDDGTLVARAILAPDEADGQTTLAIFLDQTFSTSVQFDTDYVMSIEQTADGRIILTFNGESFIFQETGPMYPISEQSYQGFTARIYAGGTGGTLLVEWDDVYVSKINEEVNLLGMWNYDITTTDACSGIIAKGIIDFQSLNGDLTKLGDLLLQGEGFSVHNGICNLVARNIVITEWRGRPAVQTASEYLAFKQLDLVGTGQTVRYDTFTSNRIVEVTTVPGNVLTFVFTR